MHDLQGFNRDPSVYICVKFLYLFELSSLCIYCMTVGLVFLVSIGKLQLRMSSHWNHGGVRGYIGSGVKLPHC